MLVVSEFSEIPEYYTGVVSLGSFSFDGVKYYHKIIHYKNGLWHRDLGPAFYYNDHPMQLFFIEGQEYAYKSYWEEMYQIYKGTANEGLCLSKLLGEK